MTTTLRPSARRAAPRTAAERARTTCASTAVRRPGRPGRGLGDRCVGRPYRGSLHRRAGPAPRPWHGRRARRRGGAARLGLHPDRGHRARRGHGRVGTRRSPGLHRAEPHPAQGGVRRPGPPADRDIRPMRPEEFADWAERQRPAPRTAGGPGADGGSGARQGRGGTGAVAAGRGGDTRRRVPGRHARRSPGGALWLALHAVGHGTGDAFVCDLVVHEEHRGWGTAAP
ncbi:hypothetical protein NKH77_42910 [Streptomyces sp. M19]